MGVRDVDLAEALARHLQDAQKKHLNGELVLTVGMSHGGISRANIRFTGVEEVRAPTSGGTNARG